MRCFQITCISRFNKAFDYNTTSAPQLKQRFQRNGSDVMSRQPMETLILDKWLYQDPIKYLTSLAKDILFYFIHVLFYVILFYLILFYLIYSFFFTGVLLGWGRRKQVVYKWRKLLKWDSSRLWRKASLTQEKQGRMLFPFFAQSSLKGYINIDGYACFNVKINCKFISKVIHVSTSMVM
jgi:hypothetical protein